MRIDGSHKPTDYAYNFQSQHKPNAVPCQVPAPNEFIFFSLCHCREHDESAAWASKLGVLQCFLPRLLSAVLCGCWQSGTYFTIQFSDWMYCVCFEYYCL